MLPIWIFWEDVFEFNDAVITALPVEFPTDTSNEAYSSFAFKIIFSGTDTKVGLSENSVNITSLDDVIGVPLLLRMKIYPMWWTPCPSSIWDGVIDNLIE